MAILLSYQDYYIFFFRFYPNFLIFIKGSTFRFCAWDLSPFALPDVTWHHWVFETPRLGSSLKRLGALTRSTILFTLWLLNQRSLWLSLFMTDLPPPLSYPSDVSIKEVAPPVAPFSAWLRSLLLLLVFSLWLFFLPLYLSIPSPPLY